MPNDGREENPDGEKPQAAIFRFNLFRRHKEKPPPPPAPALSLPVTPDGDIDYAALVPRAPERSQPLYSIIHDMTLGLFATDKIAEQCAAAKRLMEQNREWLQDPIAYNSITALFVIRRADPAVRDLFEAYCKFADEKVLTAHLTNYVESSAKNSWSPARRVIEEQFDVTRTILRIRPEVAPGMMKDITLARDTAVENRKLFDAFAGMAAEALASSGATPVLQARGKLRSLIDRVREFAHGHKPG